MPLTGAWELGGAEAPPNPLETFKVYSGFLVLKYMYNYMYV